jgi:hypothetical protein
MWMKVATAASVGAIIVGAGVGALAFSGSSSDASSNDPAQAPEAAAPAAKSVDALLDVAGPSAQAGLGRRGRITLRHFEHAEWVSRNGSENVTHDAIKGTVSSVGSTSIAVKAEDGFSLTFGVGGDTKVVLRESGKGSAKKAAIGDVKSGDTVLVTGTKTGSTLTAKHVVDAGS